MPLPDILLALLRRPSPCFLSTLMTDGSPQLTETWVTTDGEHVIVNTFLESQKVRNVRRDPRVALNVTDPDDVARYAAVRGRVVEIRPDPEGTGIDEIAHKYLGGPYPNFRGVPETRVELVIEVDRMTPPLQ